MANRFVLLVGKGELYRALARLAQLHFDYDRAIGLLQRAVSTTPNNAAAHRALGRAYVENGRETDGTPSSSSRCCWTPTMSKRSPSSDDCM